MLLGHMIFPDYLCKWNAHKYISYEITDKKKKGTRHTHIHSKQDLIKNMRMHMYIQGYD